MGHYASEMSSTWEDNNKPIKWYKLGYRVVYLTGSANILRCPRCRALVEEEDYKVHDAWCKTK